MERTLPRHASLPTAGFWLRRLGACLRRWHHNRIGRQQLAQLDGRSMADLGLSECDRRAELDKPFWR
jgi:uncharacterized protein YjiS (DUF1127 family)